MYRRPLSPELLQGDVVDHISYPVARGLPQTDEVATIVLKKNRIVLVSHSCDLVDARNKRPAFLFAPLIPVVNYIKKDADRYEAFKRNILDPEKPTFINLFRYAAASEVGDEEQMVDFSMIQALPIGFLNLCRSSKLLELTDHSRQLLRDKLMFHFGRKA